MTKEEYVESVKRYKKLRKRKLIDAIIVLKQHIEIASQVIEDQNLRLVYGRFDQEATDREKKL